MGYEYCCNTLSTKSAEKGWVVQHGGHRKETKLFLVFYSSNRVLAQALLVKSKLRETQSQDKNQGFLTWPNCKLDSKAGKYPGAYFVFKDSLKLLAYHTYLRFCVLQRCNASVHPQGPRPVT